MSFHLDDLAVKRPDPDQLAASAQQRLDAWDSATSTDARLAVIRTWNDERVQTQTARALAGIRFAQDTQDTTHQDDKTWFDDLGPTLKEHDVTFLRRVVSAPDRAALEAELGAQALALWELSLTAFDPRISDDLRAESKLCNQYDGIMSGLRAELDGERLSLSQLRGKLGHADWDLRRRAAVAMDLALADVRDSLDDIFDQLVKLRHGMAQKMGDATYTPLGYRRLQRTDYGPDQVAAFRQQILDVVVPIATAIRTQRAATLGLDRLMYWDEAVADPRGVPKPKGDPAWILSQATEMFQRLGPDFERFYATLRHGGLLDVESRDGKVPGGFCDGLDAHGVPFIFANFNGTQDDIGVVTHEAGHAFQWWSSDAVPVRDLRWPTYEACEIHSMGLEFLTFPHMELFFGDDASRFRRQHLEGALLFLPYGALVDEFQHRVYAEPGLTPDQRADLWRELEAKWQPHRQYEDTPTLASGRLWHRQGHVFGEPFYYIDYCLAQTCALQLWRDSQADAADTLDRYRSLCRLGGTQPFTGLVAAVGLENPFEAGCLAGVADSVERALG